MTYGLWAAAALAVPAVAPLQAAEAAPAANYQPAPAANRFSAVEAEIIRDYYRRLGTAAAQGTGNGKNKQKSLPPGIAKNLARGKPLPPGIAKRGLPDDLLARLPPVRDGHERVIVDGKVVLVEIATQIVRDVLLDVLL